MRYENLEYQDYEFWDKKVSLQVIVNEELVAIANQVREKKGYTDLVTVTAENEVYYNFYHVISIDTKDTFIIFVCHNSEKDDYATYRLPINDEEKRNIIYHAIHEIVKLENETI